MEQNKCIPAGGQIWNACGYVRLSHEGSSQAGNSIESQIALIREFLNRSPHIAERGMKIDDGYSGSSFARPAFQEMMDGIRAGEYNCIIVKDLSRFGRNYLETGEYLEKIFPLLGIRFIAVNDQYDSLDRAVSDELLIPFKNLINEAYCRDSSIKIRSQLEVKRRRGDFTGSFAAYGYLKDPKDKNRLIVDEFAAGAVRDMFRWKLDGVSPSDIAGRLNAEGILAPMDYKQSLGLHYTTPFRIHARSLWNSTTVLRILKNPIYTGVLEQGKVTTPSYKVKKRVKRPKEEWAVAQGAHKAVIDPQLFAAVQKVLSFDTRTIPGNHAVELFSGMVSCGECGAAMVRKTVTTKKGKNGQPGKKYVYYVCASHKNQKACSSHTIRDTDLKSLVRETLQKLILSIIGPGRLAQLSKSALHAASDIKKLEGRLARKQAEASRYQQLERSLYENLAAGIINQEEYQHMKKEYTALRTQSETQAAALRAGLRQAAGQAASRIHTAQQPLAGWIGLQPSSSPGGAVGTQPAEGNTDKQLPEKDAGMQLSEKAAAIQPPALGRAAVVYLIDRIFIYRQKRVEIVFSWQDGLCQR